MEARLPGYSKRMYWSDLVFVHRPLVTWELSLSSSCGGKGAGETWVSRLLSVNSHTIATSLKREVLVHGLGHIQQSIAKCLVI